MVQSWFDCHSFHHCTGWKIVLSHCCERVQLLALFLLFIIFFIVDMGKMPKKKRQLAAIGAPKKNGVRVPSLSPLKQTDSVQQPNFIDWFYGWLLFFHYKPFEGEEDRVVPLVLGLHSCTPHTHLFCFNVSPTVNWRSRCESSSTLGTNTIFRV